MTMTEPAAIPFASALEIARRRISAALGEDAVLVEPMQVREFHDPYEGEGATRFQPSFVVQPSDVAGVRAVLAVATELGVPVWTSSQGRNFGYGGSAPVVSGSIVLSLRRMNRILEIDEAAGYALIEPGVSFFDLYAEIRRRGLRLMMSVPDLGWGSIVGNTLDHGFGYTVYGEHASAVCGLEVVLADGEVVRTGLGAIADGPLWQRHRRGYGPSLDSLFMQSNFGVVTKMGIWLMPEPEVIGAGKISFGGERALAALVETLRPLMLDGTVQGHPLIAADALGPGCWNARIGLYGPREIVDARERVIREALEGIEGARFELNRYPGGVDAAEVAPDDLVPAGIPNMVILEMLSSVWGEGFGHMDVSPVMPFDAESAQWFDRVFGEVLEEEGVPRPPSAWIATTRALVAVNMVCFDVGCPEQIQAVERAVTRLCELIAERGWSEYRSHPLIADRIAASYDFGGNALHRLYTNIKDALDPRGVLSPGNHGIWPSSPAP